MIIFPLFSHLISSFYFDLSFKLLDLIIWNHKFIKKQLFGFIVYCEIHKKIKLYQMQSNIQIEDDLATLNLAKQIGMRAKCIPTLNLPTKEQKFRLLHWKLALNHLKQKQVHTQEPKSPEKIAVILCNTQRNKSNSQKKSFNQGSHRLHHSMRRSILNENIVNEQDLCVRTARTSLGQRKSFRENNSLIQKPIMRGKSTVLQNKTVLFQIWKQQQLKTIAPRQSKIQSSHSSRNHQKSLIFEQNTKKSQNSSNKNKKSKKTRIKIRYNSGISSFQFY